MSNFKRPKHLVTKAQAIRTFRTLFEVILVLIYPVLLFGGFPLLNRTLRKSQKLH